VTDQTSEGQVPERNVAVQEATDATTENGPLHLRAEPRCIVCGQYAERAVMRTTASATRRARQETRHEVRITVGARSAAIRRSGGRNFPGRGAIGVIAASASSFSVGSAWR
jgi:hypothetical protein